ncbi:MAG: rRNA processing protein RimM [Proteobacteria bacterium]|nr:rRNA processing protein RimM [Pseudomonadota bacterium]
MPESAGFVAPADIVVLGKIVGPYGLRGAVEVRNTSGSLLGRVLGLIETPANAVLRVGDGEKDEQLLPFVAAVVLDVDLAAKTVRVDWEADW